MTKKVKVTNLQKSFGDLEVLKGIDLEISEGEVVCLIGPSGSGKSTVLRCLNRLEDPTGGAIYFDGVNWQRMDPTFASSGTSSEFIGNGSNYSAKYFY